MKYEKKYISAICTGVGTVGNPYEMICESVLPDTDAEYAKEKKDIESKMAFIVKACNSHEELLEALKGIKRIEYLVRYKQPIKDEHKNEAEAIERAWSNLEAAIKKAEQ